MNLDLLGLQIDSPLSHPGAKNFRPPSWPPPPDWAPIVDTEGTPQCFYSDSSWPLDVWANKRLNINFGDGKTKGARTDRANADLLRQCATWFIWGPRGCRAANSLLGKVSVIKPLFTVCAEQGILATDLMRFEAVIVKVAAALAPSNFGYAITVLHELLDYREELGFCLLDRDGLARLARLAPNHDPQQTPYIPPRIWSYQLSRLRECLEDYSKHKSQVEDCFGFCLEAYAHNYGSLRQAVAIKRRNSTKSPFQNKKSYGNLEYHGSFKVTADKFGVTELIERWIGPFTGGKGNAQIWKLSQLLDLVSKVGLAYLLNFSLMRVEEGWTLRSDCLLVENDEKFGDIHMVVGETTKTSPDSDARWPVSKSASLAIDVMKHVAALRMRCAQARDDIGLTQEHQVNPFLISLQYEPWSKGKAKPYQMRPKIEAYQGFLKHFPRLLDKAQITLNEDDLRIARLLSSSLDAEEFKVGQAWSFGWHQLRRTGAVNMLSSDMVDESSLQFLLKHQSRVMTLYYGRNHTRLALNQETRVLFLNTMYQEIGRDLRKLSSEQFISPLGDRRKVAIVSFIQETDALSLEKAARKGKVGARRIRAGFCVNHRPCPYGGIEAIAHCLGGDDGKGCPDLLVDVKKEESVQIYEQVVDFQLNTVHPNSPRYRSLLAEKRAIGKFYEVVQTKNS